jgi:hypothetical protein
MIGAYNLTHPLVVGSVLGLAFSGYKDRFQLEKVLDGLKEAEVSAEESGNFLERLAIRSSIMNILVVIEIGTTKTSQFSFLEEKLQHIESVKKCDPTNQRINRWKTECLASLALLHRFFVANSPIRFNPRHQLARHFMERAICNQVAGFGAINLTGVIWKMDILLKWHIEAGDHARVEDMRRRQDNALQLLLKSEQRLMDDDVQLLMT